MKWWWLGAAVVAVALSAASSACIDSDREIGTYGSPCGSGLGDLLRCGRESGGADPNAVPPGEDVVVDECQEICGILCECVGCASGEQTECEGDCRADPLPPDVAACVIQQRCNFEICFDTI